MLVPSHIFEIPLLPVPPSPSRFGREPYLNKSTIVANSYQTPYVVAFDRSTYSILLLLLVYSIFRLVRTSLLPVSSESQIEPKQAE
jgi:hypothetical protein